MTVMPSDFVSPAATMRATASIEPPAGTVVTIVTLRLGYDCAKTAGDATADRMAASTMRRARQVG